MNKSTYGETLFAEYLLSQGIKFEREPKLPGVSQLIDFVVEHSDHGTILLEVKDIENPPPPLGGSAFDPYKPIRKHIEAGKDKFKSTPDHICALVLAAPPGSFVRLNDAYVILGAMYGNYGFRIPFDPEAGELVVGNATSEFLIGDGKMIRKDRFRNTRIAAVVTVQEFAVWNYAMRKYLNTDDGRSRNERFDDIENGLAGLPPADKTVIGVTVWENGVATRKLPMDLFRGEMDAWWQVSEGSQILTYVGEYRRSLGIDGRS